MRSPCWRMRWRRRGIVAGPDEDVALGDPALRGAVDLDAPGTPPCGRPDDELAIGLGELDETPLGRHAGDGEVLVPVDPRLAVGGVAAGKADDVAPGIGGGERLLGAGQAPGDVDRDGELRPGHLAALAQGGADGAVESVAAVARGSMTMVLARCSGSRRA